MVSGLTFRYLQQTPEFPDAVYHVTSRSRTIWVEAKI